MSLHKDCDHDHTNCISHSANSSVHQTLSEMDWERGIWYAAYDGNKERVLSLINKAQNIKDAVNAPDNGGYTAMHYAARNGHEDICRLLLQNGANINAETRGKSTPLHKAAAAGKPSTISFLIKSGALLEAQDIDGQTALHKAVANNHMNLISILLDACSQLRDIKDVKGNLPI